MDLPKTPIFARSLGRSGSVGVRWTWLVCDCPSPSKSNEGGLSPHMKTRTEKEVEKSERLIDREELLHMVPYTIQHIYRKEKEGTFPRRVRLGANRVAWVQSEVLAWISERMAER